MPRHDREIACQPSPEALAGDPKSEARFLPDLEAKTLTVRLHHTAQRHKDVAVQKLCEELTATETIFPRTDLQMIFVLGSS